MPYDWVHMAKMARPKKVHPYHIPDRASVYWLDYLIDPRPQAITDPEELRSYYENENNKFPSVQRLSSPKVYDDEGPLRPLTCHGVSTSALSYEPSSRIKELSKLSKRHLQELIAHQASGSTLIFSDSSNSMALNRAYSGFRTRSSSRSSGKSDFGKGDYRSPSPLQRQQRIQRCQTAAVSRPSLSTMTETLPPIKQRLPSPYASTAHDTVRLPRVNPPRRATVYLQQQRQQGQGEGRPQRISRLASQPYH